MTELSSELKKAEKCVFEIHTRYYGEVGKDERIDAIRVKRVAKALEDKWLPSQVVASFLETAQKKLDKIMEDRIISFEKVSRGQKLNPQIYNTYLVFIRHLKELREKFNAVLGEEEND